MTKFDHARILTQSLRSNRGFALTAAPLALAAAGALAIGLGIAAPAPVTVDVPKEAVGTYEIDLAHSTVAFKIKHLGVAYQLGRFDKFNGEVKLGADAKASSVSVTIDASSVNSNNEQRDQHLRSQDFLNAKQFPEATFVSTAVAAKDADTFSVTGDLTLHGEKKSVTFDMDFLGAKDAGERFGFKAGFYGVLEINRRDFGIATYPNDVLSDAIELTFAIESNKKK
ncbi:MAG: YceI family protein [Planctomycetota bacterium]